MSVMCHEEEERYNLRVPKNFLNHHANRSIRASEQRHKSLVSPDGTKQEQNWGS